MARPTLYTEDLAAKIVAVLRAGNYQRTAATACGIGLSTLKQWMQQKPEFAAKVKEAEADAEQRCVERVGEAATGWQAHAWLLERKHWKRWRKRESVEVKFDPTKMSDEQIEAELARLGYGKK